MLDRLAVVVFERAYPRVLKVASEVKPCLVPVEEMRKIVPLSLMREPVLKGVPFEEDTVLLPCPGVVGWVGVVGTVGLLVVPPLVPELLD